MSASCFAYASKAHWRAQYELVVKVPFPGHGNDVKLEVPVTVTSGIDQPLARDEAQEDAPPYPTLDLPPYVSCLVLGVYVLTYCAVVHIGTRTPKSGATTRRNERDVTSQRTRVSLSKFIAAIHVENHYHTTPGIPPYTTATLHERTTSDRRGNEK